MTILRPTRVQIAFAAIVLAAMALVVEGGARVFFAVKEQLRNKLVSVDPSAWTTTRYPMWRIHGIGGLEPAIRPQLIRSSRLKNTVARFSARNYSSRGLWSEIEPNAVVMRINDDGFKGPDIDKTHSRVRILTYRGLLHVWNDVRRLFVSTNARARTGRFGKSVEVINAGVEGYGPANVLGRIEEFKALRPEITTIYIGWNALYAEPESYGAEYYHNSVWLFRKAYDKVRERSSAAQKWR